MAVYTKMLPEDIEMVVHQYQIGLVHRYQEISAGIENTNYFLTTRIDFAGNSGKKQLQEWVLTIFENLVPDDLPYFCHLTEHLAKDGFDVPAPIKTRRDEYLFSFNDKVGVIVPKLSGHSLIRPSSDDCAQLGCYLAKMHLSLGEFSSFKPLVRGVEWMKQQSEQLKGVMPSDDFTLLKYYLARYRSYSADLLTCPQGTVHGDLFRDNVLFDKGKVSGVFDFYHACDATLLFDLAVIANDWCTVDGSLDLEKREKLVSAYQSIKPWTEEEVDMWENCLELAALRFWLSRLVSFYLPGYQQKSLLGETLKDPAEMKAILLTLHRPQSDSC